MPGRLKLAAQEANKMNAPWNPGKGTAGVREAYTAYVCDDATSEVIGSVVSEFGWSPEKINKGGLKNAVQSLSVSASPNILFVDLSESGDPLNDINALAEVCEPGTFVIACGKINDVRMYRDLLASGIQDYILKPCSPDHIREAFSHAQMALNAPRTADGESRRKHLVAAVIGARGGCGASMVATSVAHQLSSVHERTTALMDLDIHFGTGALTFDVEPGRGLIDALDNPSRIDGLFIERAMVKVSDKFAILSSEAPISQPIMSDGSAFFLLQEELRAAYEYTVIDLPRPMLIEYPQLIADVKVAIVVCELTLASARDMIRILSWLKTNAPQTTVYVVANKVDPKGNNELGRKEFETSIERPVDYVVPLDFKIAMQSTKLGKPVIEIAKGSKIAMALIEIAAKISVNGDDEDQDTDAADPGAKAKPAKAAKKGFFSSKKK
jgi:pilus assembly protein CpaE